MKDLLFITHQTAQYSAYESAEIALKGGCKHIQLRMKGATVEEIEKVGRKLLELCNAYDARLYIDDQVEVCLRIGASGVHVGKTDMPPGEARKLLGSGFIIGGTANTFEDIRRLHAEGVDYIGLGPFRYTTTKKNLSPVLGLAGYKEIIKQCEEHRIDLPICAIGGITSEDIPALMRVGVSAIAVSSTILGANDPVEETRKLMNSIHPN